MFPLSKIAIPRDQIFQIPKSLQSVHAVDPVQRNGEGPFRLGEGVVVEEEGGCRLPLYPPPGDGPTLPLYPPPGDSTTLGKVNIVIFSGKRFSPMPLFVKSERALIIFEKYKQYISDSDPCRLL